MGCAIHRIIWTLKGFARNAQLTGRLPKHLTDAGPRGFVRAVNACLRSLWVSLAWAISIVAASTPTAMAQTAPNCDQLQAQIAELQKQPGAGLVTQQPLEAASNTVTRARNARAAGDVEHGIELEALAADYLAIARTLMRAAALEARLNALQTKQTELETALRHTETLLEATIAQRERTKAVLQQEVAARRSSGKPAKADPGKTKKGAKQ